MRYPFFGVYLSKSSHQSFVFDEKVVFGGFLFYFDDFIAFVCYRGF